MSDEEALAPRARRLLESRKSGVLATLSARMGGAPFASVTNYALDPAGRPLLLLSDLAEHTRNLAADARASLLAFEPVEDDPLPVGRATVVGEVLPVAPAETAAARAIFLARHPAAAEYVDFGDFTLYRMNVREVYYIAGFGEMGWVPAAEYGR